MLPKVFALYLPQFHRFKENDEWWGSGYTDWIAVRNNKPLFNGHYQPHIPLNANYYDLSKTECIKEQGELAKKYNIDGFIIYHYWNNGKLIMEKPAELLLKDPSIDIQYFFSWANHDFTKSWFNQDGHLLQKQIYGGKNDFIEHYKYLSSFFHDKRYYKINGKPVFIVYFIEDIPNFDEMFNVWDEMAKNDGFPGIYLIATKSRSKCTTKKLLKHPSVDSVFIFEPLNTRTNGANDSELYIFFRRLRTFSISTFKKVFNKQFLEFYDYNRTNEKMLKRKSIGKQFYCGFPNWDNTPRYQRSGIVFKNATIERFEYYFDKLYKRSIDENNEFIVINARNEWGESAHLEPDERFGYKYLEVVNNIKRKYENKCN